MEYSLPAIEWDQGFLQCDSFPSLSLLSKKRMSASPQGHHINYSQGSVVRAFLFALLANDHEGLNPYESTFQDPEILMGFQNLIFNPGHIGLAQCKSLNLKLF